MPDLLPHPFAFHGDRLVGHHLRSKSQSILGLWLDGDAKIRSVHQFGSQLAKHYRGMALRESVSLHDDSWAGLAIVTGRGNHHHVTALHLHQTLRPSRSTPARRVRDQDRDGRPVSPPVVAPPASGHWLRRDAILAIPLRAAAAASSSFFRLRS